MTALTRKEVEALPSEQIIPCHCGGGGCATCEGFGYLTMPIQEAELRSTCLSLFAERDALQTRVYELQNENARLAGSECCRENVADTTPCEPYADLQDENEKLREALEEAARTLEIVADHKPGTSGLHYDNLDGLIESAVNRARIGAENARAALAEGGE